MGEDNKRVWGSMLRCTNWLLGPSVVTGIRICPGKPKKNLRHAHILSCETIL